LLQRDVRRSLIRLDRLLFGGWTSLRGPLYSKFPVRVVRAILERLDRLLAEQPVAWDGQKTVEHILPQNPDSGEWTQFGQEQRGAITDRIGNLVLLTSRKNSSASNLSFLEKKKIYFGQGHTTAGKKRATYASAQELSALPDWDITAYQERQDRHLALLANRWGIVASRTSIVSEIVSKMIAKPSGS
jgi:hypothetical protein